MINIANNYWTHSFIPDVTEVRAPPDAMQRFFAQMCLVAKKRGLCHTSICDETRMNVSNKMKFVPMHINFLISIN